MMPPTSGDAPRHRRRRHQIDDLADEDRLEREGFPAQVEGQDFQRTAVGPVDRWLVHVI